MRRHVRIIALLSSLLLVACDPGAHQARGFSLPEGDVENGKTLFVTLGCNVCHAIGDIAQDNSDLDLGISLQLGGVVARTRTYGELVTSVINPSHRISKAYVPNVALEDGRSRMVVYNEIITVAELTDLVTFLESQYTLDVFSRTQYGTMYTLPP